MSVRQHSLPVVLVLGGLAACTPAFAADSGNGRPPMAVWLDLGVGVLFPNTNDADRAVARYGGKLRGAGLEIGLLPSLRVGPWVVTLHFSVGGTHSNRGATFEREGTGETVTTELSLSHSEVGPDLGYVVWSTDRLFLYPALGIHRYDQSVDGSIPGQNDRVMAKAGFGLFVGLAVEASFQLSPGRPRTFLGLHAGTLLHLAKAGLENAPADHEPRPSFGAVQSGVIMLSFGVGSATP